MTLSDIKREQANAAATLANIDAYVATLHPELYDHKATIWFLIEEAEGAFIQFHDCAVAMGLKLNNHLPIDMARAYVKSAINNARK
tara:strand:- start:68 stop:325 length:258 start_codon:yes stop_codon:yes gene_type:complete